MPSVLTQLPNNTPAIYLVVGLLALVGALFGALGQIGTAALGRRHERRMKLDDVRRELYVTTYQALVETRAASLALAEEERNRPGSVDGTPEWRARRETATARLDAAYRQQAEQIARVRFVASAPVIQALADAAKGMESDTRGDTLGKLAMRAFRFEFFIDACRQESGVVGTGFPDTTTIRR